jgi:hypothetical protein
MRKYFLIKKNNGKCPIENSLDPLSKKTLRIEIKEAEQRKKDLYMWH